jgi:hypothetical protein
MTRPTRATDAGQAYLDLQNIARSQRRGTQELLTLYVVERWLARLSQSPYANDFVVKGGMLLAAYQARRPTSDLDALARSVANDEAAVRSRVSEIAQLPLTDGVDYLHRTVTSRIIRDQALYVGVRITMDAMIATARVKFRLDANFGDPVTPAPVLVTIPSLRPVLPSVQTLGYPVETMLAEKIATAIALGPANTRVRDYADIYTLTGNHVITHYAARQALLATTRFRGTHLVPLSSVIANIADLRARDYTTYRASLGEGGRHLPAEIQVLVTAVIDFADALAAIAAPGTTWQPRVRSWTTDPSDKFPN